MIAGMLQSTGLVVIAVDILRPDLGYWQSLGATACLLAAMYLAALIVARNDAS